MKTRLNNHRQSIRDQRKDLPVSEHFFEKKHEEQHLKFMILEQINMPKRGGDRLSILKKSELRWIFRLDTLMPKGLNVEFRVTAGMIK